MGKSNTYAALRLAMKWNRADVMRDELLSMATSVNQVSWAVLPKFLPVMLLCSSKTNGQD